MKKVLLIIITLLFCSTTQVLAWDVEIEQEIVKDSKGLYKSIAYDEGVFYTVGYYNQQLEGIDYKGGYDAIISKYEEDGTLIWQKSFGGSGDDYFNDCILDKEGNLIVVGYSNSSDIEGIDSFGDFDGIVIKYDEDGNVINKYNWGGNNAETFTSVVLDPQNNLVVVGTFFSKDIQGLNHIHFNDAVILKMDDNFNLLSQNSWGGTHVDYFYDISIDNEGNVIAVGSYRSEIIEGLENLIGYDGIIVKYDKECNMLWQKNWGGNNDDGFYSVAVDDNNNYVVVGQYRSTDIENVPNAGNYDAVVIKYDKDGNILFQNGWGGSSVEQFYGVSIDINNDIVVTGRYHSNDIQNINQLGNYDGGIIIYDENGNLEWQKGFGTGKYDGFTAITRDSKNNFIAVGEYDSKIAILRFYKKFDLIVNDSSNGEYELLRNKNEIYLDIKPNDKYILEKIKVNEEEIELIKKEDGYYYQLKDDSTIENIFVRDYQLELSKINNGNVTLEKIDLFKGRVNAVPDEGYELDEIIIKDSTGKEVVYEEKDGYYYFDVNDDLEITVTFKELPKEVVKDTEEDKEEENPKTADAFIYYACATVCSLFGIWSVEQYKKTRES